MQKKPRSLGSGENELETQFARVKKDIKKKKSEQFRLINKKKLVPNRSSSITKSRRASRKSRDSRSIHSRASQPKISITKRNNIEVVDIIDSGNKKKTSWRSVEDETIYSSATRVTTMSGFEKLDSMKKVSDIVVFPAPNLQLISCIEDVLARAQLILWMLTTITQEGDPGASRLLAFLSSTCFDIDVCLRYTLEVHREYKEKDIDDEQALEDASFASNSTMQIRVNKLGILGNILEKMVDQSTKCALKLAPEQQKRLLLEMDYSADSDRPVQETLEILANCFMSIGRKTAKRANKLYTKSKVFKIHEERIHFSRMSFSEGNELCPYRISRPSFLKFITDAHECWKSCLAIYGKLNIFWLKRFHNAVDDVPLSFNDFERFMLSLSKESKCCFLSPRILPFVEMKDDSFITFDNKFNIEKFCDVYGIFSGEISSSIKAQKLLEKVCMRDNFKNKVNLLLLGNVKVLEFRQYTTDYFQKQKPSKKRRFARKLRRH